MALSADSVHVVSITLMTVNAVGTVVDKGSHSTTIGDIMSNNSTQMRVVANSRVASSLTNPDIETYLRAEAAAGYVLRHIDNTSIITYKLADFP